MRSSGQLRTKEPLDYETKQSYSMTLTVSDPTNVTGTIAITVTVTNVGEGGTLTLSTPQPDVGVELQAYLDDPDGGIANVTWLWETSMDRITSTLINGAGSDVYTPVDGDTERFLRVTASYTEAV